MPRDRHPPLSTRPVLAVIVSYCGSVDVLTERSLALIDTGLPDVLVIDNTESPAQCQELRHALAPLGVEVICQGVNQGVAAAHNVGIRLAQRRGYEAVLLLDQDSQLEPHAVACLYDELQRLQRAGEPVAVLGAAYADPRNGYRSRFVRLGRLRMKSIANDGRTLVPCDLVISSGSMIPVAALDAVGPMDAKFFIDYIDIEWCARARARGWKIFGVPGARMAHTIGERTLTLAGRSIAVHSPQRQYYLVRNALLFARRPYLPVNWRIHLVYRAVTMLLMFSLLCAPRIERSRWLLLGLWHGLRGKSGRLGGPQGLGAREAGRVGNAATAEADETAPDRAIQMVSAEGSELVK